jgi:hypothetical protein
VGGGPEYAQYWKIPFLRSISRLIDQNTNPGEPVMSYWPGYLLESKAAIWPGMENHSNVVITVKLSEEEQKKYRIVSLRELFMGILEHRTRLVLFEVWNYGPGRSELNRALQESGFVPLLQFTGGKEIYGWNGGTPATPPP